MCIRDRAYEMVSPVEKNGADARTESHCCNLFLRELAHLQSDPAGEGLTYAANGAFGDSPNGSWNPHYLASRDPQGGWSSHGIEPPQPTSGFLFDKRFLAFSED